MQHTVKACGETNNAGKGRILVVHFRGADHIQKEGNTLTVIARVADYFFLFIARAHLTSRKNNADAVPLFKFQSEQFEGGLDRMKVCATMQPYMHKAKSSEPHKDHILCASGGACDQEPCGKAAYCEIARFCVDHAKNSWRRDVSVSKLMLGALSQAT
jgi:hypothetical protein